MWIATQNKNRMLNSNQTIDIFIDKTGTKIYAEVACDRDFIVLGEYKNRDACLKVMHQIFAHLGYMDSLGKTFVMPLGGEV